MARIDPDDDVMNRRLCDMIGARYVPIDTKSRASPLLLRQRMTGFGSVERAAKVSTLDCLALRRSGNFGNNYVQLVHALAVAEAYQIPLVLHPFRPFSRSINGQLVQLKRSRTRPWRRDVGLKGRFFAKNPIGVLRALTAEHFVALSDKYVRPALNWRSATVKGRLILNIRGGEDIFDWPRPPAHYGQPPLSYFTAAAEAVIAAHDVTHIIIVHQDERNPVLAPLRIAVERYDLPVSMFSAGPRPDGETIMSAEHLIIGKTTFPEALALMCHGVVSMATFGAVLNEDALRLAIPVRRRFDPVAPYSVSENWKGTAAQRAEMLYFPSSALRMTMTTSAFAESRLSSTSQPSGLLGQIRGRLFGS